MKPQTLGRRITVRTGTLQAACLCLLFGCGDDSAAEDASVLQDSSAADVSSTDVPIGDVSLSDVALGDTGEALDSSALDAPMDASVPPPCMTRVTYGSRWIRGGDRSTDYDDVAGEVTWDGACTNEGANSYATLSNGWQPYFEGNDACIIAIDMSESCAGAGDSCDTRVTYGSAWLHPDSHPAQHDDVSGVVSWSRECANAGGGQSRATLSNGWAPHFSGSNACGASFRYRQCGGLYNNPVIDFDCPDPGVSRDGDRYIMSCTGGRFRIYTSTDLVNWTHAGHVFAEGARPTWARDRFWAPEIHQVRPGRWVAYFSAGRTDGRLAVGAAVSSSATGPFEDIGAPLVHDPSPGVIDVHYFRASDGQRYLTWKVDGNAVGARTPIRIQRLADDGTTRMGNIATILTNDRSWENHVVEGQWIIERDGNVLHVLQRQRLRPSGLRRWRRAREQPHGPLHKTG